MIKGLVPGLGTPSLTGPLKERAGVLARNLLAYQYCISIDIYTCILVSFFILCYNGSIY